MPEPRSQEAHFNGLYERYFDAVRAYAWRRAPGLADEIVAETFLVAWRRLPEVPDDALPWLIGVARNVRSNLRRSDRRQDALAQRLAPEPTVEDDPLAAVDERDALRGALAGLSETDREVLLLTAWDDLDRGQVARALGCSRANVAVRLFRARRRLEAVLAEGEAADPNDRPLPGGVFDARS
jgi:RNA polymerase sigma-70 factor (ECF subfamily)